MGATRLFYLPLLVLLLPGLTLGGSVFCFSKGGHFSNSLQIPTNMHPLCIGPETVISHDSQSCDVILFALTLYKGNQSRGMEERAFAGLTLILFYKADPRGASKVPLL